MASDAPHSLLRLPTHAEFGKLRLNAFLGAGKIRLLRDWEYLDALWAGEASGFTEVLRLARDPRVVRSVALALNELPARAQTKLLLAIGLPLRAGMAQKQVDAALGVPLEQKSFVPDRTTSWYFAGDRWRYSVTCTVLKKGGLRYVTSMVQPPTKAKRRAVR